MPNRKTLYNALKQEGYDNFKDENDFNAYIESDENRRTLYNALKQEGYDNFEDEDDFNQYLGYGIKGERVNNAISGGVGTQEEADAVFEANEERFRNGQPTERVTTQSMIDAHPELGLGEQTVQKPSVKEQYILDNRPEIFGKRNASLMDVPLGNEAESPELSGDKFQARIDIAQRNLQDKEYQKGRTKAQLRRLNQDVSDALGELQERVEVSQIDRFRPANLQSMSVNPVNQELMPEYTALRKAQRLAEESENIINEAGKKGNTNFMAGLARGFWDNLNAEDYTFGADDAAQSAYLYQALDKADRGEQLTKAEETLLDAAVINMATQAYFAQDLGKGYGAGSVTAESIPFMLEMAINPISASGKTSAKMLLKYGLKKFANNKAAKVGARLLGDALAATGMAATTGAGDILEGTTDRLSKNYDYGVDADGNLYANKKADAMGMGEALARSFTTRAIENQSEMIFNAFKPIGGFMKGVQDVLPGGVNKFFDMLSHNKVADAYRWLKKSPVFRNYLVKDVRNATQIGGIFEEYAEEVYNNLANFAIGEMSWDDVVSLDNNIDTFLGLAPTQVMFGLLGLGGAGAMRYQTRRTLEDLQATMNEQQRKQLEGLLDMGLDAEEVDVRGFIRNVMQNENYTIDNKRDMIKAAFYVAKQKGIDQLTEADVIDKVYAENSLIDSVTDPSTGLYSEIVAKFPDAKEGTIEVPGNVVGWIGEGDKRQPVFVAEGMDNTEENRRVLKPGEWDASSVQEMPAEQVKTVNEEMIWEEAAVQAERESKYAPEVMNYAPQPQDQVADENGQVLTITNISPDGVEYLNGEGRIEQMPLDSWRDLMQAQFDAQEAAQKQAEEVAANTQAVVDNMPRKTDETGRIFVPKAVQGDEVAYDITDAQGNILEQGTSKVSQFAKMQDYVAPVDEKLNDDGSVNDSVVKENLTTEVDQSETGSEGAVNGISTQETAESVSNASPVEEAEQAQAPTLESVVASLPKTSKGEIDYGAMTPQQQYQYTSLSESPEVALEDLQADIAANEEELVKMQDELGKARGGKRAELRDKVKKLTSANEELKAFYESVAPKQEPIAETENTESADPIKYAAEEVEEESKPIVTETEKPKKARKPKLTGRKKSQKPSEFTDEELRPANGVELAAEQLAAGNIKITVDSYKKETGYGEEERKKLGLTPFRSKEKGGISIERAAEKLVEEDNATHNGRIFNGDTMAARDAIIELFSMSEKWSDVTNYIQNNRMVERQKREEAEYAEYEDYIMQTFHMSVTDYESAKEYDEQNNPFEDIDMEGKDAIFAEEYLKYEQYLNSINNDEGRTDETPERSDSVLSQERVGNIGGNQRNESQGIAESVGSEPLYNSETPQESAPGSEVAPSIEETNVGRMADIEARILEIEGRRNEINDELSETPDYDTLAIAELRAEEWELEQEQAELEAEYSGLRAMNDESNAISEAEGSGLRFRESAKEEENRRKPLRERAKMWSDKLGVKVRIMENLNDVTNPYARRAIASGQVVTGWFEESTGEVCIYMPHINSESEVDATYIHEVVAHKGLRGLLGEKFDSFCDEVWDIMSDADRLKFMSYPGVSHLEGKEKSRAAADEYIAHLSENIDVTESAWSKFAELVRKFLKALGLEPKITNADIANTIKKSYQRLLSGENAEGNVSGEGTRFNAKRLSDRRQDKNRVNNTVDQAVAFVMGKDVKEVKAERIEREQKRKEDAAEIYQSVLSGDFNDVTLQKINDYIDDATPLHPYGRRISQRLPQKLERSLHEGSRTNAVDALFSRICESSVPASRRTSEAGRREIEERKKEALKGWAIATNNWHTDLSEFTDEQTPFAKGTDSEVFLSKDGKYVIKTSFGKPEGKRFRPDIDNIPLFNHVFRNSAYEIVGYGEFDGKFARILKQPFVEFAEDSKVSVDERVDYMHTLGFEPINEAKTAFSNGTIIVADLQKSNIVKTAKGNIRVIDADVKLHTKDVGGNYTYPPVEADLPEGTRFRVVKDKNGNKSLVGLHNISEEKLRKAIKQGGLANPSMAVIDLDKQAHVDYGDITLIAPADLIDKNTGRSAGTYMGDAWTPTYPKVTMQLDNKGWKKINQYIESIEDNKELHGDMKYGVEDYLDGGRGMYMNYAFLKSKGLNPEIFYKNSDGYVSTEEIKKLLGVEEINTSFEGYSKLKELPEDTLEELKLWVRTNGNKAKMDEYKKRQEQIKEKFAGKEMPLKFLNQKSDDLGFGEYDHFVYDTKRRERDNGQIDTRKTFSEANYYVAQNGLGAEFDKWMDNLLLDAGAKEVFFAGYTPSGNKRYMANTIENVSKFMNKQSKTNAYDETGFGATKALFLKKLNTLEEIREQKDKLVELEEYRETTKDLSDRMGDLIGRLSDMKTISSNKFMNYDYAASRLQEAMTKRNPIKHLNDEYGYDLDKKGPFAEELAELIKDIKDSPARYFETKFERPVYLNEFAAAVVPQGTSKDVVDALTDAGLPVEEYEKDNNEARMAAVDKVSSETDGVRFRRVYHGSGASFDRFDHSYMSTGEGNQSYGWGTYLTDVRDIGKGYAKRMGYEPVFSYKGLSQEETFRKYPELQYISFLMDSGLSAEEAIEKRMSKLEGVVNSKDAYWLRKQSAQESLDFYKGVNASDIEFIKNRHLYDVEIPGNDGTNYLEWDKPLSEENKKRIKEAMLNSQMYKDYAAKYGEDVSLERLNSWMNAFDAGRVYRLLENFVDNDDSKESAKAISMLLSDAGYVGFEYPANFMSGGNENGEKNYVIFNEDDLKIVEHTRFRLSDKGRKIQNEVDKFTEKYNSVPVDVIESGMTDKELVDAFDNKFGIDDIRNFMKTSKTMGGYIRGLNKVIIFADRMKPERMEESLFHENIHALMYNENHTKLLAWFYEFAKDDEAFAKWREISENKEYELYERPEEFFSYVVSNGMVADDLEGVLKHLDGEMQNELKELLNKIGYDYDVRRRSIGQSDNGRTDEGTSEESVVSGDARKTAREQSERLGNLFGQVADMGLDGVLGNKEYTRLMVDIYKELPEDVRTSLADDALRHYGGSIAPAVSDYVNKKGKANLWDKIAGFIREALRKVGIDVNLNANDAKYILWRSRKPLDRNNLLDVAEDIDMRYRLKVGEFEDSLTRFRSIEEVNDDYNRRLDELDNDRNQKDRVLRLGKPGRFLNDGGVSGSEIEMEFDKFVRKSNDNYVNDHPFSAGDIKNLPKAINAPIAVFDSTNHKDKVILTELKKGDNNFIVVIKATQRRRKGGVVLEVNEISTLYPKNAKGIVKWINDGLITNVDKRKALDWLEALHTHRGTGLINQELDSATKIVESFENPKIEGENVRKNGGGTRFRVDVGNKLNIRDEYEATIKKGSYQAREAVQDNMLSLRRVQELIEKASGKKLRDFENAWMHENRLSSVVQSAIHEMERKFYKPMTEAVKKLMGAANLEQEQVADYLMLKHGIERNREMAVRKALTDSEGKIDRDKLNDWYEEKRRIGNDANLDTWRKKQEAMDDAALMFGADMSRDYSGLTSMFDTDDLADCTERAYNEVEALEDAHPAETEALRKAIKAMTQNTLDESFGSGLMNKAVYEELSNDMYDYYIPLRGFEETTSDEVYAYMDNDRGAFNAPLVRAKGRSSKSDNPLAYLKSIAESGIMQGERNKMKQTFLNMVTNHPSDLVSVREGVWAIFNPATGEWEAASFPESKVPRNATPADVDAAYEKWEEDMELRAKTDPNVKKISEAADVPYRVIGNRMNQHQVIVKRLGKSYTLTINGNPRLAMALNGLTNPNNTSNDGKVSAYVQQKVDALNRNLSAWYTTRNPDFVASNFMRDTFYTNTIVRAKEGNNYANHFHAHYAKLLMPGRMISLFSKYENGTLDLSKPIERDFHEFMMNGGETGYSNLKDLEYIKKQIAKDLKGGRLEDVKGLLDKLDLVNRAVENTARFAAYRTSRQQGRSVARSIFDAKEISVNFNKKGAGGTFFGATGQTWFGNLAAMVGAGGRAMYVFFNAAIQGTTNLLHVMKVNPAGTGAGLAAMFLMGAVLPMLLGGDDEKDYYDLPDHVRRNHLILPGTGDSWISIPLPIEYRIMYGMGELLTSWRTGHERGSNIGMKMLSLTGQALPLNFLEEGVDAFMPSALSPLWQVYNNRSWTGLPIYKDNEFNKDNPEYTKAYKNVNRGLYKFTKALYRWTFDEENQEAGINLNPAAIEHIAKGYFGGLVTTLDNVWKTGEMVLSDREFDWRNIPVGNRIFKTGDERTKDKRTQNEYFENVDKLEFMQSRERLLRKTKDGAGVPEADKLEADEDYKILIGSDVYKKYVTDPNSFKAKKKKADKLYRQRKEQGDSEKLERDYYKSLEEANKAVR